MNKNCPLQIDFFVNPDDRYSMAFIPVEVFSSVYIANKAGTDKTAVFCPYPTYCPEGNQDDSPYMTLVNKVCLYVLEHQQQSKEKLWKSVISYLPRPEEYHLVLAKMIEGGPAGYKKGTAVLAIHWKVWREFGTASSEYRFPVYRTDFKKFSIIKGKPQKLPKLERPLQDAVTLYNPDAPKEHILDLVKHFADAKFLFDIAWKDTPFEKWLTDKSVRKIWKDVKQIFVPEKTDAEETAGITTDKFGWAFEGGKPLYINGKRASYNEQQGLYVPGRVNFAGTTEKRLENNL